MKLSRPYWIPYHTVLKISWCLALHEQAQQQQHHSTTTSVALLLPGLLLIRQRALNTFELVESRLCVHSCCISLLKCTV